MADFCKVSFGKSYSNLLKDYFKEGKLPSVKKGFYGEFITNKNVSLEHLETADSGQGPTIMSNLVLADKDKNRLRGNRPLQEFFDYEAAKTYLSQFKDVKVGHFDGNLYISQIIERIKKIFDKK